MDANEIQDMFLLVIEEQLRLSRHLENTQQALRLVLSSIGGNVPQEAQLHIDFLLAAHEHDDLIRGLSQAAKSIREKLEKT